MARVSGIDLVQEQPKPTPTDFERVWAAYPRKVKRLAAENVWKRLKPAPELATKILTAINAQRAGGQWKRGVIPNLHNWLTDEQWRDEVESAATRPGSGNLADPEKPGPKMLGPYIPKVRPKREPSRSFLGAEPSGEIVTPEQMRALHQKLEGATRKLTGKPETAFGLLVATFQKAHPTWTREEAEEAVYRWQNERDLAAMESRTSGGGG
jgi:hypothetical protein